MKQQFWSAVIIRQSCYYSAILQLFFYEIYDNSLDKNMTKIFLHVVIKMYMVSYMYNAVMDAVVHVQ